MSSITKSLNIESINYQIDFKNGFKYWDVSGDIFSKYLSYKDPLHFSRSVDDLEIGNLDGVKKLRHGVQRIWLSLDSDNVEDFLEPIKKYIEIASIVQKVEKILRVGLRFRFVIEPKKDKFVKDFFSKFNSFNELKVNRITFNHSHVDRKSIIHIEEVINNNTKSKGIMFDVDLMYTQEDDFNNYKVRTNILIDYFNGKLYPMLEKFLDGVEV